MDPRIVKKTQDTLGKIIKKPPLTEKLLSKPPFRFLHDIITSVSIGYCYCFKKPSMYFVNIVNVSRYFVIKRIRNLRLVILKSVCNNIDWLLHIFMNRLSKQPVLWMAYTKKKSWIQKMWRLVSIYHSFTPLVLMHACPCL